MHLLRCLWLLQSATCMRIWLFTGALHRILFSRDAGNFDFVRSTVSILTFVVFEMKVLRLVLETMMRTREILITKEKSSNFKGNDNTAHISLPHFLLGILNPPRQAHTFRATANTHKLALSLPHADLPHQALLNLKLLELCDAQVYPKNTPAGLFKAMSWKH